MKKRIVILKVDLYTRIILSLIALGLVGLLIRPAVIPGKAGAQGTAVQGGGVAPGTIMDVNIAQINGRDPDAARPIRVNVARSQTIPVDITNREAIGVTLEGPDVLPVRLVEPSVLPVDITGPRPLPVVPAWNQYWFPPKGQ